MKHLVFICVGILAAASARGQDEGPYKTFVAKADRYFEDQQYHLAIQLYRDALAFNITDPAIDYRLAECYRHTFDYPEAETYYLKALYTGQNDFPMSLFYYALTLKLNGNISEAIKRFDQFIAFHDRDVTLKDYVEQAIIEKAGCEIALQEFGIPVALTATLAPAPVNTPYNDFAPAVRDENALVITSSRIPSNRKLIDDRNGEAFTDNYYFVRDGDTWKDRTRPQFSITNSLYHDGSGSFTKNGDQYFFTVCEERCRIYETHLSNNQWTKPTPLNEWVNAADTESKHPAISPGGDTLFFASNRAGGYGLFDIWMSVDAGDNAWSAPINAGPAINTKANDIAPSITDVPSVLFFSSEGHPGYGGFDLFVAKGNSSGDTVLYNLNLPFNSVRDDCFLSFHGQEIYWSSNRDGGMGGFDIYKGDRVSAIGLVSRLSLKNRNDSRAVTLMSRTAKSEHIHLLAARNEETIDYNNLTYERRAAVNRMVENRMNNIANRPEDFSNISQEEFEMLSEISHERFQTLLLKQKYASTLLTEIATSTDVDGPVSVTGRLLNPGTGSPVGNTRILLTNQYGEILKITSTNEQGYFRFTDVSKNTKLFLRMEGAAMAASGQATRDHGVTAFVTDIQVLNTDRENSLYVENVYFDFDHYTIRPEAEQVLSELASWLQANPGAQVEIYAFADDRGSSAYNFELTQKRGEAVVAFLTRHGVDETSLAIIPKGKQVVRAAKNEIQRQYNRRAEFYINGARDSFTPMVKTYILKKDADWELIATITGIPAAELKVLNGSHAATAKAYQPIRVPAHAKILTEELFFVGI